MWLKHIALFCLFGIAGLASILIGLDPEDADAGESRSDAACDRQLLGPVGVPSRPTDQQRALTEHFLRSV